MLNKTKRIVWCSDGGGYIYGICRRAILAAYKPESNICGINVKTTRPRGHPFVYIYMCVCVCVLVCLFLGSPIG